MPVKENSQAQTSNIRDTASSSGSSEDVSSLSLPTPPDGGWGWVVVGASFMVHLIADGCAFSFGVLYVELLLYFKEPKGTTALVGSLFLSVPLITGPIASALTNKYGCRSTTIIGGIIASFGFIISSFVTSIGQLCLTFGIIAGFGLSMVYVSAVVIVAYYFEKRRAFATGMAVAGSGIGTFVFAPLTELLIDWYTWKGAVLILGGIMLNIVVCGAFFRPLINVNSKKCKAKKHKPDHKQILPESQPLSRKSSNSGLDNCNFTPGMRPSEKEINDACRFLEQPVIHSLVQFPTYLQKEIVSPDFLQHLDRRGKTVKDLLADPEFIEQYYATQSLNDMSQTAVNGGRSPTAENTDVPLLNGTMHNTSADDATPGTSRTGMTPSGRDVRRLLLRQQLLWQEVGGRHLTPRVGQAWPMQRKDIFYRGSLLRPRLLQQGQKRAASCPDIVMRDEQIKQITSKEKRGLLQLLRFSHEVKLVLHEMMDVAILRSYVFVFFCVSCTILYLWYDIPYVYLPDKAILMKITDGRASFLVAIIGITSTVGQIVVGYIGDRPGIDSLQLYNVLTSVAGVATMLVPLIKSYIGLLVYAATYGFFISGNYALTTIIIVELCGMEKLTNAYGLVMLAEGVANLLGPPLAGFISDYTGSYDETFYIGGAGIIVSGMMMFAIPLLRRADKKRLQCCPQPNSMSTVFVSQEALQMVIAHNDSSTDKPSQTETPV